LRLLYTVMLMIGSVVGVGCRPAATVEEANLPHYDGGPSELEHPDDADLVAPASHEAPMPARVAATPEEAPFVLTPSAATKVRELIAAQRGPAKPSKLRISMVEKFGGDLRWTASLTDKVDPFDDETFESHGILLVVDRGTRKRGAGTTIDYVSNDQQQGFTFHNPTLKSAR
jgi:iron-sulfur cluster assembly accessory protein